MSETRTKSRQKLRVLLVDDDEDIVRAMTRGLGLRGIEVTGFSDPLMALEHFTPGTFALLVTDIRMGQMNGFELYRRVRRQDEVLLVYFLSAYDNEDQFNAIAAQDPLVRLLKKPIGFSELAQLIIEGA